MAERYLKNIQRLALVLALLTGTVVSAAVRFTPLYAFETNGIFPSGPLVRNADGNFYGVANSGGKFYQGNVFQLSPNGSYSVLYSFDLTNGAGPAGGLALSSNGFFYGTTQMGGTNGYGTIFKFRPGDKLISVFSFAGTNGGYPYSLVQGNDGNLYGITQYGGETSAQGGLSGYGTVFRVTPKGVVTTLAVFHGPDGAMNFTVNPQHLAQDESGNLYGTTLSGGAYGFGTVFKLAHDGTLTTLVDFNIANGAAPNGLIPAKDGNFYGTTYYGGAYDNGTVFQISKSGEFTELYSFSNTQNSVNTDGANPDSELLEATDGSLYGTTLYGGQNLSGAGQYGGIGTIFKITTNGIFNSVASFGTFTNDFNTSPVFANQLIEGKRGDFFATTRLGGVMNASGGYGSFFKLSVVRPLLVVSKPPQNAQSAVSLVTVFGKAEGKKNTPVTDVFYRLNGSGWNEAVTTNGWKNWAASVSLMQGTNVFKAYAVDATGTSSRTNVLKLNLQAN